jgi:rod shape-determining protein MreC
MAWKIQGGQRKWALFIAVLALVATVATSGWRSGPGAGLLDRAVMVPAVPLLEASAGFAGAFEGAVDFLLGWKGLSEENLRLREEVARLRRAADERREQETAYHRLADILDYQQVTGYGITVAAVIGYDSTNLFRTVLINKGTRDGLRVNLAVVTPRGAVGRIIKAYKGSSRVLLINDRSSGIDALVQRTRDQGVVQGLGLNQCEMKYLSRQSDVAVGDTIVTSGMGGIFPKGVRVGTVKNVKRGGYLLQKVKISPTAFLDRLEEVVVLTEEGGVP